jgi:hypothetical protein
MRGEAHRRPALGHPCSRHVHPRLDTFALATCIRDDPRCPVARGAARIPAVVKPAPSAGESPARRSRKASPPRAVSRRLMPHAREIVALVGVALVGAALFVFLVVADWQFVTAVHDRAEASTLPVIVAGAAAAVMTVLGVIWYSRRADGLSPGVRRRFGRAAIAWSVLFVVAFFWTHPKSRDAGLADPLHAGVVTYVLLVVVVAVGSLPIAVRRLARPARHRPGHRTRVWRMSDKEPYFVAYCDCGWVGSAHGADEAGARENAFSDARGHGTNVSPEVEDPLG